MGRPRVRMHFRRFCSLLDDRLVGNVKLAARSLTEGNHREEIIDLTPSWILLATGRRKLRINVLKMNDEIIFRLLGLIHFCGGVLLVLFHKRLGNYSAKRFDEANVPEYMKTIMRKMIDPKCLLTLGVVLSTWGAVIALFILNP